MIQAYTSKGFWRDFDWALLIATAILSTISLAEIYSSTTSLDTDNYFLRQLAWVLVGVVFLFVIAAVDYRAIAEHIPWIYIGAMGLLICTLLLGRRVSGAKSWLYLGPLGFQPSELVKMVVVVALARYLAELRTSKYMTLGQIVKAMLIWGIPVFLIALQPDLGTAVTYLPILAVGLFLRGIKPVVLVSLVLGFLLILPAAWLVLKPYQKDRITNFVYPERDPAHSGYQVIQSKIAIGSGGLFGKGLFRGSQNQLGFLPTRHTDFIFSVVGEELGFVGVMATLGLLAFILFRSVANARTARDTLGVFVVMGIVGMFFFHIVVNVGMVIGFLPTTGIPLPFMSYGGSSVLTAFLALGLVASVRRRRYVN